VGHPGGHLPQGRQLGRLHQLPLHLDLLRHILEDDRHRRQLPVLVQYRVVGEVEHHAGFGLPPLVHRLAGPLDLLQRALRAGFRPAVELGEALAVQCLVPETAYPRRETVVVLQHVVVGVDEEDRVGHRLEGCLPLLLCPGYLFVEAGILDADGELVGQVLDEGEISPVVGVIRAAGDDQGADDLVPFEHGGDGQGEEGAGITGVDPYMAQLVQRQVEDAGFLLADDPHRGGVGGKIVDSAVIPRHHCLEGKAAVLHRHQAEKLAGEGLGELGEGPLDDVGNGHVDVDVPGQPVEDLQAAVLPQHLLAPLLQFHVVVELGRIDAGQLFEKFFPVVHS